MTGTASPILLHGHSVTRPTPDQLARVDAHLGLITWVIEHRCRGILDDGYQYADARQDGWLGLLAAVQTHPEGPHFGSKAISAIWREISRGRGLHSGRNHRRRPRLRQPGDRPVIVSIDQPRTHDAPDLASTIPATGPSPADTALASIALTAAVTAGRAAVTDHVDIAVLAWMLTPGDTRTPADLAIELRLHPEAIRRRRTRFIDRMSRAAAHPATAKG